MKKIFNSNKTVYIILCFVILAGICRFSYGFFVEKQGTHSDEEWSFGLANSYYEPYIYSSDDDTYTKNCNEWLSGTVLKDYLTVQKGERFSFGSVYYNMACDMHPPLYFFVLHFLSSFFVDQYIPALGFIINIICYIIMSIFLYRLLLLMSKSRYVGILGVIFNTFNVGTLSMVIFIRMYTMVTMFAVILAYYNAKLYYDIASRKKISTYIKLAIFTCLGALTHHFFLPYAFMLTAIMCICWMVKKEWHVLAKYAGFMILGVALSIAIFPATLDHMLGVQTFKFRDEGKYDSISSAEQTTNEQLDNSTEDINSSSNTFTTDSISNYKVKIFKYYFNLCCYMALCDIFGFSVIFPYNQGIFMYFPIILLIVIILLLSFSFLFRKETFFLKLINKTYQYLHNVKAKKHRINWFIISLICSILFVIIICSIRVNIIQMSTFSTRYLFIIYPIICIVFVCFLNWLLIKIYCHKKFFIKLLSPLILITMLLFNNYKMGKNCTYFFNSTFNTDSVISISKNANVIIASPSRWHLTIFAPLLYQCDNFYYSFYDNLYITNPLEDIKKFQNNTYIIVDTSRLIDDESLIDIPSNIAYNNINATRIIMKKDLEGKDASKYYLKNYLSYIESYPQIKDMKYIGSATDFGITMEIYKLEFRN